eukprot:TRINITY_DN13378_c0_g2_i1.p1 TRINITY_DN13378_c0_g2~~TRINITY_DN13378_c0_g2_i1.p1  ORF type:complete len:459 (+),score=58.63 TRINITY_DN13378_c0_g2_i1:66-1442(+)
MGSRRYGFKVLCPDSMVSSIMGPGGRIMKSIEETSGCSLKVSGRDEVFPSTWLRSVTIHADSSKDLISCLDRITEIVMEMAENESAKPSKRTAVQGEADFTGKEPGELIFRILLPCRVGTAVIGPGGQNVKQMIKECGTTASVKMQIVEGHQMCRLQAPSLENLRLALDSIVARMEEEALDRPEEFARWVACKRVFDRPPEQREDVREPPRERESREHRGHVLRSRSPKRRRSRSRDAGKGQGRDRRGTERDWKDWKDWKEGDWKHGHSGGRSSGGKDAGRGNDPISSGLEVLASAVSYFEEQDLDGHEINCELPSEKISAIIGNRGEYINHVTKSTGVKINFSEVRTLSGGLREQTMHIRGPLLGVYRAHVMVMQRYHEHDQEQNRPPPRVEPRHESRHERRRDSSSYQSNDKVAELKDKMAALQRQLEKAERGSGRDDKGRGRGGDDRGGHGRRRR